MTPLEHAQRYAALGWRVAPIPPGHKYPAGMPDWQTRASTDPALIERWFVRTDTGVSIVTGDASGIFVVDVDPRHGGDETLADLVHEHGPLPDTVEAITGGGGRHLYFAMPAGATITNDAGRRLGPGLDVRGEGGQVVAPPTVHPDTGARYEWEASSDPLEGATVAEPPAWLVELLVAPPAPPRAARRTPGRHSASDRPGDRFEAETEWADLLSADGWTLFAGRRGREGDYELWTRPGKDPKAGASASLYWQGSDVLKVFTSSVPGLDESATYTRFGYWAAVHHGGDHGAAARALAERYRPSADDSGGYERPSNATSEVEKPEAALVSRPSIVHNGRLLEDVTAQAIAALAAANTPEAYFVRAGQLVRVRADEDHRPLIESLNPTTARLALADAAAWYRALKDGALTATSPPLDIATSVLGRGSWPLPPLAGVVELPVLRPDGTFATAHGYDAATKLYHWHHGAPYAPVPASPTGEQLAAAVALVDEALGDFPWDTTADRANAWGLLLTPLVRALVPQVPMALVDAPEPGTGKGLLVQLAAAVTMGRAAALMAWPATEEELEKKATAALMAGSTMIIWDNVEGMIRSGTLAAVLTAESWQGRVLGRSEMVMVPNRATWAATGNNIDVGGDLARRCYRIRLDARQAQPWKRTGFRHPDLVGWATAHRSELLGALCTVVAAWWAAGRPSGDAAPAMGGYTPWVRTVGGILGVAGVGGFLENLDAFHADADQEARQWEAFLTAWSERYGEQPLTTAELVDRIKDLMIGISLRESLPDQIAGSLDKPTFGVRLGQALRRRAGRHYGAEGIHITEMPRDRRKTAIWCVTTRSVRLFEDEVDTDERGVERGVETTPRASSQVTEQSAGFAGFVSPSNARDSEDNSVRPATRNNPANPATPRADEPDWGQF